MKYKIHVVCSKSTAPAASSAPYRAISSTWTLPKAFEAALIKSLHFESGSRSELMNQSTSVLNNAYPASLLSTGTSQSRVCMLFPIKLLQRERSSKEWNWNDLQSMCFLSSSKQIYQNTTVEISKRRLLTKTCAFARTCCLIPNAWRASLRSYEWLNCMVCTENCSFSLSCNLTPCSGPNRKTFSRGEFHLSFQNRFNALWEQDRFVFAGILVIQLFALQSFLYKLERCTCSSEDNKLIQSLTLLT